MRDSLDKILNTYAATYDRLEGETLRSIVVMTGRTLVDTEMMDKCIHVLIS